MKTLLKTTLSLLLLAAGAFAADLAGTWKMSADGPDGNNYKFDLQVKQADGKYSGALVSERGSIPMLEVAVNGADLAFKIEMEFGVISFKLKQDGDVLKGQLSTADGMTGPVNGKRDGAAAAPALTGKWKITAKDAEGNVINATFDLKQNGADLNGEIILESGDTAPISQGKVDGDKVTFKLPTPDGEFAITGSVSGAEIKGTYKTPNGSNGTFSGKKN